MIFLFVSPMTFLPFLPLHPFCDVKVLPLRLLFFFLLSRLFYCLSAAAAAVSLLSLLLSFPFSAHFLLLISLVIVSMFNFLLACDMLPFLLILKYMGHVRIAVQNYFEALLWQFLCRPESCSMPV